jgi:hypothetical protein
MASIPIFPTNLTAAILVSAGIHLAALAGLPCGDESVVSSEHPPQKLAASISRNLHPGETPNLLVAREMVPMDMAGFADDKIDPPGRVWQASGISGVVVREKPVLRFVREIDLDAVADLDESGYVELELLISPDGKVVRVSLLSTDISEEFFGIVAQAFEQAEFTPERLNGVPVSAKFRFRTVFGELHEAAQ